MLRELAIELEVTVGELQRILERLTEKEPRHAAGALFTRRFLASCESGRVEAIGQILQ